MAHDQNTSQYTEIICAIWRPEKKAEKLTES